MPSIQPSLLPLVQKWGPLLSESGGLYPYYQEGEVRNGIPLHLTLEDYQLGYSPLAWVSKQFDEGWSSGWTRTSECPFTRHEDENSGGACWYVNQDVLDRGAEAIREKMQHAYLHLARKGLAPERPLTGERQSVYADPRSTYFSKQGSHKNGNEVFEIPRKLIDQMGFPHYGTSMVAYTKDAEGIKLWVAKRAKSKSSFPGLLDITVSGGLPARYSIEEGMAKEAAEEAGLTEETLQQAIPAGCSAYLGQTGILEYEYLHDLELPADYTPQPVDGEVEWFELRSSAQVIQSFHQEPEIWCYWAGSLFINFLARHGIMNRENEPHFDEIVSRIHNDPLFVAQDHRVAVHRAASTQAAKALGILPIV